MVFIWAISSIFIIENLVEEKYTVIDHHEKTLTSLLEYEIRNDRVFEKAYPDEKSPDAEISKQNESPVTNDRVTITENITQTNSVAEKETEVEKNVKIDNVQSMYENDNLNLSFEIKNLVPKQKAVGFVFAIAKFISTDGQTQKFVAVPKGISINELDGTIKNSHSAYRYSIMYYKLKSFSIPLPKNSEGKFESVNIYLKNEDGEQYEEKFAVEAARNLKG